MRKLILAFALAGSFILPGALVNGAAHAEGTKEVLLTIKDHRFDQEVVKIPAETRVKVTVKNLDSTPEEFESKDLRREKIIPGGGEVSLWIGPLPKGEYAFFGEFNEDTAKGKFVVE